VWALRRLLIALVAAALAVLVASPAKAITNGEPDGNRHPYVGLALFEAPAGQPSHRCSASLLSPIVVLTAGHCTDGTAVARVWFAEDVQTNSEYPFGGATSYEGVPYTNPDFCIGCGNGLPGFAQRDVGIIVLSEPVPTSVVSDYAELPSPGLVDDLSKKAPVTLVGYGVQERIVGGGPPVWAGLRIRLMAPARLVSGSFTHSEEFVRVTASPGQGGGTCFGDSGGPILNDGTDTVLAVNSYVTNGNCAGVTYSQRIDIPEVLAWIRSFP
jgi:secreted trypsin-like serine protease